MDVRHKRFTEAVLECVEGFGLMIEDPHCVDVDNFKYAISQLLDEYTEDIRQDITQGKREGTGKL